MSVLLHGPLPLFIAQAVLIITAARLIGILARRMRQPMVIAEIVAGILLGPSLLGWAFPDFSRALFPPESLGLLNLMSQIGLILFMFLVGLEFDAKLLRGRGRTSVVISHTSIVVPFTLGALLALYLYPRLADPAVRFSSFTLFIGAAMSITAFPVLARILVERRLMQSKIGALTITCAAVDDVTAWCILAFVVSIVRVTSMHQAVATVLLTLLYIVAMAFAVRPFIGRLAGRSANREGLNQNLFAALLVLLLASSWSTELIGIHALFGAFVFGAIVPKTGGFAQLVAERLEDLVVVLMLPLFFAYSGLRTQIGLLDSPAAWAMCGLIIVVACVGKFGGSAIAARLTGLRWREAAALGILMNTRGLIELIVLNIGLDLGVISPTLFTMLVLMALVTTFATSPLLEWVYPISELGEELAGGDDERTALRPAFTVLMCVAYDRSGPGMVTLAAALAGDRGGLLYALRLVPPNDRSSFVLGQRAAAPETTALTPLLERARELDLDVHPLAFVSSQPAEDICNVAAVKRADLVLMGWHKPLLGKTALGGTVHEVMRHAPSDVGVLVDRGLARVDRVLVPYLGSLHDRGALALAARLARFAAADVTVLGVVPVGDTDAAERLANDVTAVFDGTQWSLGSGLKIVEDAEPAEAALRESEQPYDLLLIGAGAEWGLAHRPFGVHAETIIARSTTSLLIVRQLEGGTRRAKLGDLRGEAEPAVVAAGRRAGS